MLELIGDEAKPIGEDWIVKSTECQMKDSRFYLESNRKSMKNPELGRW